MNKPMIFNTPGRECAHADKGQCTACQLRPHRYKRMQGNSVFFNNVIADAVKMALREGAGLRVGYHGGIGLWAAVT